MTYHRRPIDRPESKRCVADVTLRDGSHAQCQRLRKVGTYCRQHAPDETRSSP